MWTTLGELFTLQAGKNITAKNISPTQNAEYKYPCFGGNGIRGFVVSSNRNGSYPIIGRQGALCGNVNLANGEFYATEHAVVVDFYCETDFMWCYYTLEALNLNQYATATAQPGLAVNIINEVSIPLPPYKEQKVISEAISHWLSLIDTIGNSKEQLKIAIKQTKSKILDLAIHGKLVPQDPNDEPASELLKRVNPKAEIACDNPRYGNLPKGWCKCRLRDVCSFINGYAFSSDNYKNKGIPLVRISNITNDNGIDLRTCVYIQHSVDEQFIVHKGDLLIAMSGATTGKMGVYSYDGEAYLNQRVGNLKASNALCENYMYYLMYSHIESILKMAYGGAQPNISAKAILSINVLLPPLQEQHRIVAKIEELFAQLDKIGASL